MLPHDNKIPPFAMPMFRNFVPKKLRPWIYVVFAITFQLSGGVYLGALNEMMGDTALMREDILMCLFANLCGMAVYFPLLFRMKFRFTNKTLLFTSALGIAVCNFLALYVQFLPLLWAICFISGCFKIQGTFECMSNIQLWITPKREFTIFFPVLNIIILCSIQLSDWITTYLCYMSNWQSMNYFMVAVMLMDCLVIFILTKPFRIMKKFPLLGIDWLGALLWALAAMQVTFVFNYGEYYDWWDSNVIRIVSVSAIFTIGITLGRMWHIKHPYIDPQVWKFNRVLPVLFLISIIEGFLASEYVLEEVFFENVMEYPSMVSSVLDFWCIIGIIAGGLFSLLWMKVLRFNFTKLISIGLASMGIYFVVYYFSFSTLMNFELLRWPLIFRGFSYVVLSVVFMQILQESMDFKNFFQGLSIFNFCHMVIGGVIGAAIYAYGLRYFIASNTSRFGAYVDSVTTNNNQLQQCVETFFSKVTLISIRQLYGLAAYMAIFFTLLMLLYDLPYTRSTLKKIPSWNSIRKKLRKSWNRG